MGYYKKEFIRLENNYFKFKKESTIARILIENKNVNNDDNKIKEKKIKKIMNNINNNNIIIKYILINLIAFLTINIFYYVKSNILFDLFNPLYSSTIKLKIKGIGNSYLFGNEVGNNFTGIKYLKEVKIMEMYKTQ